MELKVGMRVRSLPDALLGDVPTGTLGTVVEADVDGSYGEVQFDWSKPGDNGQWPVYADEVEVVLNEAALAPQTKKVLSLLRAKQSLTSVEAAAVLKVRSLSKRICELKAIGVGIHTEIRRDSEGQRYARYYLVEAA